MNTPHVVGGRAYTADEIAALQQAVHTKWLWGRYNLTSADRGRQRTFLGEERDAAVALLVQEHMAAGRTAADLYASEAHSA